MTNSSQEMVDVSNKPYKWPFFSLLQSVGPKLREAVERGLRKPASNSSTETINRHQEQQPQDQQVHEQVIGIENTEDEIVPEDDPGPPESEVVLSSIKEKLEQVRQDNEAGSWVNLSIYQIPHYLKHGEDKAYVPQIVSLGPYYHGRKQFQQMEWHKYRCLDRMLRRTGHKIDLYLDSVKEVEGKARSCYLGNISMKSDEFVDMMALDGCFVIELLLGVVMGFETLGYPSNDPVFLLSRSMDMIQVDMLKLENQIPLFVLDHLLSVQYGIDKSKRYVAKLALGFFKHLMPQDAPQAGQEILSDDGGLHFLEVCRLSILGLGTRGEMTTEMPRQQTEQRPILRVTDLREAGIEFSEGKKKKFWDIEFKDGTLWIPRLLIHEGTRSLFLNLIAFEQSHFHCSNEITSYIFFMDNLIDSPQDVKYLRKRGIIKHRLGSDAEEADLFNNMLCQNVVFSIKDSYLSGLYADVKQRVDGSNLSWRSHLKKKRNAWTAHLNHKWNAWIAILKHSYFNNPWSIISVIAASVLLVLTAAQTFYGVYGYYRPRSGFRA